MIRQRMRVRVPREREGAPGAEGLPAGTGTEAEPNAGLGGPDVDGAGRDGARAPASGSASGDVAEESDRAPGPASGTGPEAEAASGSTDLGADADAVPGVDVARGPGPASDGGTGTDADTRSGPASGSGTASASGSGSASGTGTDIAPSSDAGAGADADSGTSAETPPASDEDPAPDADQSGAPRPWYTRRALMGIGVASIVLALSGGVLLYQAHELRADPAAGNHALTDADATNQVNGDVSSALAKVFSYAPGGTDATERSAREVLSGRAAQQYTQLFAQVRDNVSKQHVTLTTQAVRIGTVSLHGDTAHLLVFLDQSARRGKKKPTTSAAQLSVTARLHDGVWQIVDIKAR